MKSQILNLVRTLIAGPILVVAALPGNTLANSLFVNGSLDGPSNVHSLVPSGWYGAGGSIDTIDQTGHPFADTFPGIGPSPYGNSSDGGTFVWAGGTAGVGSEGLGQDVNTLTVGQNYVINFEYTNLGLYDDAGNLSTNAFNVGQDYNSLGRWLVEVDGIGIGATPATAPFPTPGTNVWSSFSLLFTATSTIHAFSFRANMVSGSGIDPVVGMGIDAVSLSAVPIPASIWLFGSGLLGLIGISRRKKA